MEFNYNNFLHEFSEDELKTLLKDIQAELEVRERESFQKEKEKVLKVLKEYREKFPYGSIEFETQCGDCYEKQTENILEYLDELRFFR